MKTIISLSIEAGCRQDRIHSLHCDIELLMGPSETLLVTTGILNIDSIINGTRKLTSKIKKTKVLTESIEYNL